MSPLRRFLRRQWYRRVYLRSGHWRAFRASWWAAHPRAVCQGCGFADRPMDLHHLTYERIGHELFGDVIPLHRYCHRQWEHGGAHRHSSSDVTRGWVEI